MSEDKYEFGEDEDLDQMRIDISITKVLRQAKKDFGTKKSLIKARHKEV